MYQNKDTMKAVLGESIQVHVLTEAQLKSMADKHTVMIKLSSPYRDKSNNIFWKINDPSFPFKNSMDIAKTNIAIVCKYEELKHDTKLCFVGAFKKKPCDDDMVLLCLIMQTYKKKEVKKMNVQKIFKQCSFIKNQLMNLLMPNITKALEKYLALLSFFSLCFQCCFLLRIL